MLPYLVILSVIIIIVLAAKLFNHVKFTKKTQRLTGNEINSLLSKRMHVKHSTRKAFEIDKMLLSYGYSFVTTINLVQHRESCVYTFNELASNGNRFAAWKLCRAIKSMSIEGIEDVMIPKPGYCTVYTKHNVSFTSLQKVFTLLGVHQCDIVEKPSYTYVENGF